VESNQEGLKQLACVLGGGALGALLLQNHYDEARKSRAEKDDPDSVAWLCELIGEILEDWEPRAYATEDEYTESLYRYLNRSLDKIELEEDVDAELRPDTEHGVPDILINDQLVLELKVNPNKAERDRLIGQCSGYSREWVTWVVVIDLPNHEVGELERLLAAKNLHYIEIIPFD
jgi:hypothetical protein